MKKYALAAMVMAMYSVSHAEVFQVKSVTSYNIITATQPNTPGTEVTIRINNLDDIDAIRENRVKVLLSRQSALDLSKAMMEGQLVRIENLTEDGGTYVGDVYLSYEQVVRGYAKQHLVGGNGVAPEIKKQVMNIAEKMIRQLDSAQMFDDDNALREAQKKAQLAKNQFTGASTVLDKDSANWLKEQAEQTYFTLDSYYMNDYLKCIFVYEALLWYKDIGQFLPEGVQKLYIGWVASYQNSQPQKARDLEVRIRDMTVRYELYQDFIFD